MVTIRMYLGLLLLLMMMMMMLGKEVAGFVLPHQSQWCRRPCLRRGASLVKAPPSQPYRAMSKDNDPLAANQEKAAACERNERAFYSLFVVWFTDFFRQEIPAEYKIYLVTVISYSAASIWSALLFDDCGKKDRRSLDDTEPAGEHQSSSEIDDWALAVADKERSSKDMAQQEKALVETDTEKSRVETKALLEWDMAQEQWNTAEKDIGQQDDKQGRLKNKALPVIEPEPLMNVPPFDPDAWRMLGWDGTVPWSNPQKGLIKYTGGVEFSTDLSPQPGRNWMMEVCFKPSFPGYYCDIFSLNPIFSQRNYKDGWELQCKRGAVKLFFTTIPDEWCYKGFSYNEQSIRASSVEIDQWTHVMVFFDQSTSTLWCYVNGAGPGKKTVSGTFKPCPLNPRLGQSIGTPEKIFLGEVAFARVDQQSPLTPGKELTMYAATLANARLSDLEGGSEWELFSENKIMAKSQDKALPENKPLMSIPPFDPDGWRMPSRHGTVVPWSIPQQGWIRFEDAVEFSGDLSPQVGRNWLMEVCFKPEYIYDRSYNNVIFSQRGDAEGWELRYKQGAVALHFVTAPDGSRYVTTNEEFIPASTVETGKWTHFLAFFDQSTSTLWFYINGAGPVKKTVRGPYERVRHKTKQRPKLGGEAKWPGRTFQGEVAFARVDQQPPLKAGKDLTMYAATLAKARLSDLE